MDFWGGMVSVALGDGVWIGLVGSGWSGNREWNLGLGGVTYSFVEMRLMLVRVGGRGRDWEGRGLWAVSLRELALFSLAKMLGFGAR